MVVVCVAVELVLALALALLFLDEWPWRKIAVSVILLPMMIIPVDAANAFFMLFNERGPINHLISLALGRSFTFSWLSASAAGRCCRSCSPRSGSGRRSCSS